MFEEVLAGMRDGVMLLDADGKVVFANDALAEIFQLSQAEMIGRRPLEIIRLPELAELASQPGERELRLVFPREKYLMASAFAVGNGVAVIIRDITELKRLESWRQEFVANVSHELKTPLTAIRSGVETLLDGAIDDQQVNRRFLQKIEKNVTNLSGLIEDILAISSLEARRGIPPFERVEIEAEVDRAIETIASKAQAKQVEVKKIGQAAGCSVQGESNHIYRAILNLLDNAVKYSEPGGTIEISCRKSGDKLELSVTDHGQGIEPEHQARIFERFYRVDKARSREMGGTGLGLSIVKHIMDMHGGSVRVESRVGEGSVFTLAFPA